MTKRLISLIVFFIHVTVHSTNANADGEYTTDLGRILREMEDDDSVCREDTISELKRVSLRGTSFVDICSDSTPDEKLSICIEVVQHKWEGKNPTAFIANPRQSDWKCRTTKFYGKNREILKQRMYLCPPITVKMSGKEDTESSFLIGQGLHLTKYRVRAFKQGNPADIESQLTGLSLNKLNFTTDEDNYVYIPDNDSGGAVYSFRWDGKMSDYKFVRKD